MSNHFTCHVYRTDQVYDQGGLSDSLANQVAAVVGSVWDPAGDPIQVYANVVIKLKETFPSCTMVSQPNKYVLIPDGNGGYKPYCVARKLINVMSNGVTVAVEISWGVEQAMPK